MNLLIRLMYNQLKGLFRFLIGVELISTYYGIVINAQDYFFYILKILNNYNKYEYWNKSSFNEIHI